MGAPLISIVTVVRNDRSGFEATGQSIATQQFRDFEWVVVDGASTDGLPDDLSRIRTYHDGLASPIEAFMTR